MEEQQARSDHVQEVLWRHNDKLQTRIIVLQKPQTQLEGDLGGRETQINGPTASQKRPNLPAPSHEDHSEDETDSLHFRT